MDTSFIIKLIDQALSDIDQNGQNGAMSAGSGSFNSLCTAVALKVGAKFDLVAEVLYPLWDEFWEFRRMEGLDMWPDKWHDWKF